MKSKLLMLLWIATVILVLTGCGIPTTGTVNGVLIDGRNGKPLKKSMELWQVEISEDGQSASILPQTERLTVESNNTGTFEFKDVEPGQYMIFVETGASLTALVFDERGTAAIEVEAGQVIDLGEVPVKE